MNEYKIEVANEAESKEVQELFFELGYAWLGGGKSLQHTKQRYFFADESYRIAFATGQHLEYFNESSNQQITLPELRILAMLKRNDVNDATHEDEDGDKWFIRGDDCYLLDSYDGWVEKNKTTAKAYNPQPITPKNEITLLEALERLTNGFVVEVKYPSGWALVGRGDSIGVLLESSAFRVPAPTSININGNAYTEAEALKLIKDHFHD